MSPWLLYGCTGWTGKLIAAEAAARGERPVLAGRNERRSALSDFIEQFDACELVAG